jgi:DNA-binding IclR family transcriptional regulator
MNDGSNPNTSPSPSSESEDPGRSSVLERATLILDAFEDRSVRLRLDEVAAITGLPRSTCYRLLATLVGLDWLQHKPGGYAVGPRATRLGGASGQHAELRAAAVPLLQNLALQTGCLVHLGMLEGEDVLYLDELSSTGSPQLPVRVGGRSPAYASALGKAMLAWLPPEDVDRLCARGLRPRTAATITDAAVLHEELRRIRSRGGLAFDNGEYLPGLVGAGVAIRVSDDLLGGVSVSTDTKAGTVERIAPLLLEVSRRIRMRLDPDATPEDLSPTTMSDGMMERFLMLHLR